MVAAALSFLGLAFPGSVLGVQAGRNLAIDPLGRVVEVSFDEDLALTAPWDRFRFDIDIGQPLARDGGAFWGDLTGDGVPDLVLVGFTGEILFFPGIAGRPRQSGKGFDLKHTTATPTEDPFYLGGADWLQGDIGDLDDDGKKDLVIGGVLYSNVGTSSEPVLNEEYVFTGGGVVPTSVINSTADPGAGVCDVTECTLREAIAAANTTLGPHRITFNIPTSDPGYDGTVYTIHVGGGPDKACDGVGDLDAGMIGFVPSCPAVTVPGGPSCAKAVTTLSELVACVDCVTEFKVDCLDRAQVPQFAPYPRECNP